MRKLIVLIALFVSLCSTLQAQFGPGGVGDSTSIGLWLRAELIDAANATAVDTWFDVSDFGNNAFGISAAKTPTFVSSSAMNGQPAVRFDGSNDEMTILDADILDNSSGLTFYTALRPANLNGNPRGILGKRINQGTSAQYAYTWFFWSSDRLNVDLNTQNNRFNTGATAFSNNTNYVLGLDFRGDIPAARRARVYSQGVKVTESTESSTVLTNSDQDLVLGALNTNYGDYLGADYGELVHFNYSLDTTEHILVQNYLAAKFGITLSANGIYRGADAANGDHDFDVAGIGRVNANSLHDDAQGTGIIRILNPTDLNNNEFLIWGHNNGNPSAIEASDVPAGVDARLDREWYITETNASGTAVDVGAVDIRFDLSSYATTTVASDLRLLIDSDADGAFSDEAAISGASLIGGSIYAFTGVTALVNGTSFTLGTANSTQTPLPVELIHFGVQAAERGALITWSTASEVNHSHFTIERSSDGIDWVGIATKEGTGDHATTRTYRYLDKADPGTYYYRLQQLDLDGTAEFSEVKRIVLRESKPEKKLVFPNPADDRLYIAKDALDENWQLIALDGVRQEHRLTIIDDTVDYLVFSLEGLKPGYYIFKNHRGQIQKVLVQR